MKNNTVLMLIKTDRFDTDDRLLKECKSLSSTHKINVVGVEKSINKSIERYSKNLNTTFKSPWQLSRFLFKPESMILLKAFETYVYFIIGMCRNRASTVWVHEVELMPLIPIAILLRKFGFIDRVIWDQHELPPTSFQSNTVLFKLFKSIFKWSCKNVNTLIVTNSYRIEYICEFYNLSKGNICLIENLVGYTKDLGEKEEHTDDFLFWLKNREYAVVQGGITKGRYYDEIKEAIRTSGLPLVVIGNNQDRESSDLIYYTGYIPQVSVFKYIKHSLFSFIFYKADTPNNLYCSPNRLFQSLELCKPVIVGCNPPMKCIIDKAGSGIVLESDGSNVGHISQAIKDMLSNYSKYSLCASKQLGRWRWEQQEPLLLSRLK